MSLSFISAALVEINAERLEQALLHGMDEARRRALRSGAAFS